MAACRRLFSSSSSQPSRFLLLLAEAEGEGGGGGGGRRRRKWPEKWRLRGTEGAPPPHHHLLLLLLPQRPGPPLSIFFSGFLFLSPPPLSSPPLPFTPRDKSTRGEMSSSGGHQHSQSRAIPTRTVPISDSSQLPHDYCTTPGGTLFSTTPGGTRIIYDRKFLLDRRNSPMAQTPPCHLPNIPGVTSPGSMTEDSKVEVNNLNNHDGKTIIGDDAQFEMDI